MSGFGMDMLTTATLLNKNNISGPTVWRSQSVAATTVGAFRTFQGHAAETDRTNKTNPHTFTHAVTITVAVAADENSFVSTQSSTLKSPEGLLQTSLRLAAASQTTIRATIVPWIARSTCRSSIGNTRTHRHTRAYGSQSKHNTARTSTRRTSATPHQQRRQKKKRKNTTTKSPNNLDDEDFCGTHVGRFLRLFASCVARADAAAAAATRAERAPGSC